MESFCSKRILTGFIILLTVNRLDSVVLTPPHPPPSPGQLHFCTNTTCHYIGLTMQWLGFKPSIDPTQTPYRPNSDNTSFLHHFYISPTSTSDLLWIDFRINLTWAQERPIFELKRPPIVS